VDGEPAAGKWYDAAKATFTTLVDSKHAVSSAFQFVNVPSGVWIDERGRVVRPAETAWNSNRTFNIAGKVIDTEGEAYVAALRDWVANGERSRYALSDREFAARVTPRSSAHMEAEASFKLAVWFQRAGRADRAAVYFARAQKLNPDSWNYHRQEWSFSAEASGKKFQEKVKQLDTPYYPRLELESKTER
jgi:hypothetical protein